MHLEKYFQMLKKLPLLSVKQQYLKIFAYQPIKRNKKWMVEQITNAEVDKIKARAQQIQISVAQLQFESNHQKELYYSFKNVKTQVIWSPYYKQLRTKLQNIYLTGFRHFQKTNQKNQSINKQIQNQSSTIKINKKQNKKCQQKQQQNINNLQFFQICATNHLFNVSPQILFPDHKKTKKYIKFTKQRYIKQYLQKKKLFELKTIYSLLKENKFKRNFSLFQPKERTKKILMEEIYNCIAVAKYSTYKSMQDPFITYLQTQKKKYVNMLQNLSLYWRQNHQYCSALLHSVDINAIFFLLQALYQKIVLDGNKSFETILFCLQVISSIFQHPKLWNKQIINKSFIHIRNRTSLIKDIYTLIVSMFKITLLRCEQLPFDLFLSLCLLRFIKQNKILFVKIYTIENQKILCQSIGKYLKNTQTLQDQEDVLQQFKDTTINQAQMQDLVYLFQQTDLKLEQNQYQKTYKNLVKMYENIFYLFNIEEIPDKIVYFLIEKAQMISLMQRNEQIIYESKMEIFFNQNICQLLSQLLITRDQIIVSDNLKFIIWQQWVRNVFIQNFQSFQHSKVYKIKNILKILFTIDLSANQFISKKKFKIDQNIFQTTQKIIQSFIKSDRQNFRQNQQINKRYLQFKQAFIQNNLNK